MIDQTLPDDYLDLADAQEQHEQELLNTQNVVGVGLGHKFTDGEDTGKPAVQVLVRHKMSEALLSKDDLVRSSDVGKKPVDVIEVGEIFAGPAAPDIEVPRQTGIGQNGNRHTDRMSEEQVEDDQDRPTLGQRSGIRRQREAAPEQLRQRTRPVMGGYSVGHPNITAGTIATCCYDLSPFPGIPGSFYILSNNHVLANSNNARQGDPILQPGPYDGGQNPQDQIGRLSRYVPIRFRTASSTPLNYVDAALAEVPFHQANREIFWIGYVKDLYASPKVGDTVQKTGRTTNFSTGKVQTLNATVDVNYGGGRVARFARQILTTRMSAGGDSGSLVTTLDEEAVGLLFAGSSQVTVLNNIIYVQSLLKVRLHEK